jgi:hypothetical protein
VWEDLPPTIARMTPETSPWIRQVYLGHLTATTSHYRAGYESLTNISAMLLALERLPEGREWLRTNQIALSTQWLWLPRSSAKSMEDPDVVARTNILATLERMGMASTNLTRLSEYLK